MPGGVDPPAPTQPGAIAKCAKWHTVVEGDTCWAIADKHGISLENFYLWNPGVGSSCSSLWLGYAVCVGI
jgi:LysM repeat protein